MRIFTKGKSLCLFLIITCFLIFCLSFLKKTLFINQDNFIIPPGQESEDFFVHIVDDKNLKKAGWDFFCIYIQGNKANYKFKQRQFNAEVSVILSHPSLCNNPVGKGSKSFCIRLKKFSDKIRLSDETILIDSVSHGIENNSHHFKWQQLRIHNLYTIQTFKSFRFQFAFIFLLFIFLIVSGGETLITYVRKSKPDFAQTALLIAVVIISLIIRLSAKKFTCDIKTPIDMGFVFGYESHRWAAGYSAYLHLLFSLFNRTCETVYMANIFIGTMTVLLLYVFVKIYLKDDITAFASAAVLACLPIHAKFSASDSPHILLTFSYFSSLCFLCLWATRGNLWFLIQGLGWLFFIFNIRHESLVYSMSALLIVLGCLHNCSFRKLTSLIIVGFLFAIFVIKPVSDFICELPSGTKNNVNLDAFLINPFFYGKDAPFPLRILAIFGVLTMLLIPSKTFIEYGIGFITKKGETLHSRKQLIIKWLETRRLGICLLLSAFPIGLPSMYGPMDSIIWNTNYRYFITLLATYSIFAGHGLKSMIYRFRDSKWVYVFVIIVVLISTVPWWGILKRTWTHQLEFEFVRKNIKLINNGCTIVRNEPKLVDAGFEPSPYISVEAGLNHKWVTTTDFLIKDVVRGCVVYYQSSSCFAKDINTGRWTTIRNFHELPECTEMRKRFKLIPIAKTLLPALPYVREEYTRKPVPVGFYFVKPKNIKN